MTDTYTQFVNTSLGKTVAGKLGLPRPALLRRYKAGAPLTVGPVLLVADAASTADAATLGTALREWGLDVVERLVDPATSASAGEEQRWGAIVVVLTGLTRPADAAATVLALPTALKRLAPGGRVVTVSTAPADGDAPPLAAARHGVDGFLRSLAKEMRAGATANGILLAGNGAIEHPSTRAALRFLLSAKSAFVDGQFLTVGNADTGSTVGNADTGSTVGNADTGSTAGNADVAFVDSPHTSPHTWDRPLDGRVAVVTGAARGIGAAIARTLARDGATVVCVDVPGAGEGLARTANAVRGTALQLDVTAPDAGERILSHARERHGRLDVVVHNAGILRDKLLANMDATRWESVVAVNVEAQLRINEALLAAAERGELDGLRIVSLASTSGIAGNRGQTNYGFTKAGVIGHTGAMAALLALHGGGANAVAPGFIETDMTRHIPFVPRQVARRANSLQQGGQPIDVAEAVAFLASPLAAGITGQTLRVCGQNLVGR